MATSSGKRIAGTLLFIVALVFILGFFFLLFASAEGLDHITGVDEVPTVAIVVAGALGLIALILFILVVTRSPDRRARKAAKKSDRDRERAARDQAYMDELHGSDTAIHFHRAEPHRPASFHDTHPAPRRAPQPAGRPASLGTRGGVVPYDIFRIPLEDKAWGRRQVDADGDAYPYHYPRDVPAGVYANDYVPIDAHGSRLKLRTLLAAPPGVAMDQADDPIKPAHALRMPDIAALRAPAAEKTRLPSDDFMDRLEARYRDGPAQEPVMVTRDDTDLYYDYVGDIHDVIDVEGIGEVYAKKLKDIGVRTTARLVYEDAEELSEKIGAPERSVRTWQAMAELMKVSGIGPQYAEALARAGVTGIPELKKRSSKVIADQVNDYLEKLGSNVLGQAITEKRVAGWQDAARPMRRVRMQVPQS